MLADKQQRLNAEALKLTCSELAQRFARYVLGDHITFTPIERILLQDALDSYARRPSSAPSVAIERVKAWFYSKPRKQAQAAFTAGDERQIAYMLEDAEAKVLLANQAKAVVAMNSAAQSASGQIEQAKALLHEAGARLSIASYLGITAGTDTTVNKIAAFLGDDYLPPLAATADRAARTEAAPIDPSGGDPVLPHALALAANIAADELQRIADANKRDGWHSSYAELTVVPLLKKCSHALERLSGPKERDKS